MSRILPTYNVEIAWSTQLTGVFRLDISLLDGPDVLPGTWGNNVYDDLTGNVLSVEIRRGAISELTRVEQGECIITLTDPSGIWNPENPSSPLAGLLVDMRPVRIRATHLGVTYGLFYGFVTEIVHHASMPKTTTIRAVDFTEWLAGLKPVISATGTTAVGAAIGLILDAAEWTDASMRSLDVGDAIPGFSADGSKSGVDLINELLVTDQGMCFVDGAGRFCYRSRASRYKRQTPVDTFDASMITQLEPALYSRNVINRQTVTRTGGIAQTATNEDSRKARGWRDGSPISSGYLVDDTQALNLAQWLVTINGSGLAPSRNAEVVNVDDASIIRQLSREMGDRVEVTALGMSYLGTIVNVQHTISGGVHRTRYTIARQPVMMFTLGVSLLDSSDILGY